ncbi:hypothetical protein MMH89_03990 [Candidatus Comchoanobacter bicostacola]|uniref:Uncharacterized protein n=1 Tax=Candidatus Comchoanobacter bicostacola TaxID=2919598 RepID=A0ABY5DIE4_9GAMM|nr:hypothetical protein [Candidatus Comchoanobacter bicostacola]UTC24378.1 hypothetical protein MMH89_03990 [Candidatus Comchoanobacter bicostacola]
MVLNVFAVSSDFKLIVKQLTDILILKRENRPIKEINQPDPETMRRFLHSVCYSVEDGDQYTYDDLLKDENSQSFNFHSYIRNSSELGALELSEVTSITYLQCLYIRQELSFVFSRILDLYSKKLKLSKLNCSRLENAEAKTSLTIEQCLNSLEVELCPTLIERLRL